MPDQPDLPAGRPRLVSLHGLGRTPADWDGIRTGLQRFGTLVAPQLSRDPAAAAVTPWLEQVLPDQRSR